MNRIEAVIFDFGEVIAEPNPVSTGDLIVDLWKIGPDQVAEFKLVYRPLMKELVKGRLPPDEFWRQLSVGLKREVPGESYQLLGRSIGGSAIYPEMIEFAKSLKQRGLQVPILSNATQPQGEANKQRGAYAEFNPVILSYEIGLAKPDPKVYKWTLEKLELPAWACIFVDDKEENLVPARELGIRGVLAQNPTQVIAEVNAILNG